MSAYYNEYDKHAAAWLRELIRAGQIADGVVDDRSIEDVHPRDLDGFAQCHFFAGIGIWSYALRCAGWPDDRPVWTGSCPCQPFSAAGQGAGFADERHLWPAWHHLIRQHRPAAILGEQVASKDADPWLDLVQDDLEALGYAFGAVAFPAAGVGAPHIRDRTYWVGNAEGQRHLRHSGIRREAGRRPQHTGVARVLGDSERDGLRIGRRPATDFLDQSGDRPIRGFWSDAEWIACRDGKARPVEPGTFPLVAGSSSSVVRGRDPSAPVDANSSGEARVMRLRGYGNAINAEAGSNFIRSYMEARDGVL